MAEQNFNLLRLACLIQDRDNQDFKRIILSLIFELLYERNNEEIKADELHKLTIEKCSEPIERDFFESIIANSKSFVVTNTENEPFVKLTQEKFIEVEKSIEEFSIDAPIARFLKLNGLDNQYHDTIIKILYQSIYENIYAFNPENIKSLIPNVIKEKFLQDEIDVFNRFLEEKDDNKNRILYNQFVKAIEFAILTSGKGVKKFSEDMYTDKIYILDTNIIFRILGVGGEERRDTIIKLIQFCQNQGIVFEYTWSTLQELERKLEDSIRKIKKAEETKKIEVVQELLKDAPHFFNDDFITQYSRLKNEKKVKSPEQYELEMKTRFKQFCERNKIEQANHGIKIEGYEVNLYATKLQKERKKLSYFFWYSQKQAQVDAYNVLYVRKRRGGNNFNYSEVKSFYLTTDRGLNRILSSDEKVVIPETILPSQLFVIHNPLTDDKEVDFENFFSFLKRRTSEFKHRGRDVFSFINQAHTYTTDKKEITNLILTFTDQRYKHSKIDSIEENVIIKFKDFAKTYFDEKLDSLGGAQEAVDKIDVQAKSELEGILNSSKSTARLIDIAIMVIGLPLLSLLIGFITNILGAVIALVILEALKFFISLKGNYNKRLWELLFKRRMKKSNYFLLTKDEKFIKSGLAEIDSIEGKIW